MLIMNSQYSTIIKSICNLLCFIDTSFPHTVNSIIYTQWQSTNSIRTQTPTQISQDHFNLSAPLSEFYIFRSPLKEGYSFEHESIWERNSHLQILYDSYGTSLDTLTVKICQKETPSNTTFLLAERAGCPHTFFLSGCFSGHKGSSRGQATLHTLAATDQSAGNPLKS